MNLCWLDTETTGLDPNLDAVLEIAMVITTPQLVPIAELSLVIDHGEDTEKLIERCDDYVGKTHTNNGLFEAMLTAPDCTIADAEALCIALMQEHHATDCVVNGDPYRSPMCGSTISFDRSFLKLEMGKLEKKFSYRNVDVSSFVEIVRRWFPGGPDLAENKSAHRALSDVKYSIDRLNAFHWGYFKTVTEVGVA